MTKRRGNLALGGLLLAALGYLAGILTAPKSGKDTRKDIQRTALKAKTLTEKELKTVHSELNDLIEKAKLSTKKVSSAVKLNLDDAIIAAQDAREKVREILSAFHEGEPEDKDLKRAMKEAKNAIDHLKKYVVKPVRAK
jgi:gas vesicle protein